MATKRDPAASAAALREAAAKLRGVADTYTVKVLKALAQLAESGGASRATMAALERLRVDLIEAPPKADDRLEGLTGEAVQLADALVRSANRSWKAGKVERALVLRLDAGRKERSTRKLLLFLTSLDLAASPSCNDPGYVIALRLHSMDPAAANRVTPAIAKKVVAAWKRKRGAAKWAEIATTASQVLFGPDDVDSCSEQAVQKAWKRHLATRKR